MHKIHIYLTRHGQSEGNLDNGAIFGQSIHTKLTDIGKAQAKQLGEHFVKKDIKFDKIMSSSYLRAADTTNIMIDSMKSNASVQLFTSLVEYSPGAWRGQERTKVLSDIKNVQKLSSLNMGFKFPSKKSDKSSFVDDGSNGDSLFEIERKISSCIEKEVIYNEKILELADKQRVNIFICSHGMTIKTFLHYVMGFDQSFIWKFHVDNCSITHLTYGDNGWYMKSLGSTKHLKD